MFISVDRCGFWGLLGRALSFIIWENHSTVKELILAVVPYIKGNRWFVRDYIILMLLSPFINVCLTRLSKEKYRILIMILLLIFSIWPSFFSNPPIDDYGFSCVHFILLYTISGYLKLHWDNELKLRTDALGFLSSVCAIYVSAILGLGYSYAYNLYLRLYRQSAFSCSSEISDLILRLLILWLQAHSMFF